MSTHSPSECAATAGRLRRRPTTSLLWTIWRILQPFVVLLIVVGIFCDLWIDLEAGISRSYRRFG